MSVRDQYAYLRPQPLVWLFILVSMAVHAGLVGLLIIGGLLKDSRDHSRDRARITALLRKGKPRPKDWLPRKLPAPAPAPTKEVRADPSKKADASKKTPVSGSERTDYSKQMSQALASLTKEGGGKSDEEPEGSPDGVDEGTALIAQLGNEYMTKVYTAVKAQYAVPEIISQRERMFLSAVVVITLDSRGNIKDLTFEKRSDNQVFDSAIEAAIRRAAPFPPPPSELVDKYASEGIGLEFDAKRM